MTAQLPLPMGVSRPVGGPHDRASRWAVGLGRREPDRRAIVARPRPGGRRDATRLSSNSPSCGLTFLGLLIGRVLAFRGIGLNPLAPANVQATDRAAAYAPHRRLHHHGPRRTVQHHPDPPSTAPSQPWKLFLRNAAADNTSSYLQLRQHREPPNADTQSGSCCSPFPTKLPGAGPKPNTGDDASNHRRRALAHPK